ncbi:MAG TPA: hypothetical protein VFL53_03490 [Pseudolabrys sp.]|nr:hypothetical protein [Pseudolabrys sp.]
MSRYKGQLRASRIEVEFPHHVDIIVPPGGLGRQLNAIYEFHIEHGIKPRSGRGTHRADGAVIHWCFAEASLADAFPGKFRTRVRDEKDENEMHDKLTLLSIVFGVAAGIFGVWAAATTTERENSIYRFAFVAPLSRHP